ncbi:hypothetical protein HHI36_023429 [Cryptolaemus montrouzieri]|uniref:Uncharacterized protein n=1 Tax=Cryptolaemus montrouzieri TaxID=559131 RepID=A0ABD2PI31_9CUCU
MMDDFDEVRRTSRRTRTQRTKRRERYFLRKDAPDDLSTDSDFSSDGSPPISSSRKQSLENNSFSIFERPKNVTPIRPENGYVIHYEHVIYNQACNLSVRKTILGTYSCMLSGPAVPGVLTSPPRRFAGFTYMKPY